MSKRAELPLVSVIVTTKNNEVTLKACLESIKQQSYKYIELIVVDNSSTDDTKKVAKNYTKLVFNKGPERSAQRNYAVKKSSGEYVFIVDSDMKLSTDVVRECVNAIDEDHKAVIIPEESFGVGFWAQCKKLERSFYIGVDWIEAPRFYSKELYLKTGGYSEDMSGGEDWELYRRVKDYTKVTRVYQLIFHNEGKLSLAEIVRSRIYYTKGFSRHFSDNDSDLSGVKQALNVYLLLLKNFKTLFKNPLYGFGTLLMKTVEFGTIGIQLLKNRVIG